MLKVGDKVRWIGGGGAHIQGMRGEILGFEDAYILVKWDAGSNPTIPYTYPCEFFIKEFQPGDRVILLKEQAAYDIKPGLLGRISNHIDGIEPFDFSVEWDQPHNGAKYHLYKYSDCYVAHTPTDAPPAARNTPLLPPPPPEPPTRLARGRCYFCAAQESPWRTDRYVCDTCHNRYR